MKSQRHAAEERNRLNRQVAELIRVIDNLGLPRDFKESVSQLKKDVEEPLYIMVVGAGNAGKSSLINGVIGARPGTKAPAKVGRVPTTWTIDVYEKACGRNRVAELSFLNAEDEVYTDWEALAERLAELKPTNKDSKFKTDLYQVKYFLGGEVDWPPPSVALVDTGGYGQERGGLKGEVISIFGADGIEFQQDSPFETWIRRADIVLWCVAVDRVQDADTAKLLQQFGAHCEVHGILTKADKLQTDEERGAIRKKADQLFGKWVHRWHFVQRSESDGAASIDKLRAYLEQLTDGDLLGKKVQGIRKRYEDLVSRLREVIGVTIEQLGENFAVLNAARSKLSTKISADETSSKVEIQAIFDRVRTQIRRRLEQHYRQCGSAERFLETASEVAFDRKSLQRDLSDAVQRFQTRCDHTLQSEIANVPWTTSVVDESRAIRRRWRGTFESTVITRGWQQVETAEISDNGIGDVVGVGFGLGAALVATLALGPIGVLAAGLGWFAKNVAQQSALVEKVQSAAVTALEATQGSVNCVLEDISGRAVVSGDTCLEQLFVALHGKWASRPIESAKTLDRELLCIGGQRLSFVISADFGFRAARSWGISDRRYVSGLLDTEEQQEVSSSVAGCAESFLTHGLQYLASEGDRDADSRRDWLELVTTLNTGDRSAHKKIVSFLQRAEERNVETDSTASGSAELSKVFRSSALKLLASPAWMRIVVLPMLEKAAGRVLEDLAEDVKRNPKVSTSDWVATRLSTVKGTRLKPFAAVAPRKLRSPSMYELTPQLLMTDRALALRRAADSMSGLSSLSIRSWNEKVFRWVVSSTAMPFVVERMFAQMYLVILEKGRSEKIDISRRRRFRRLRGRSLRDTYRVHSWDEEYVDVAAGHAGVKEIAHVLSALPVASTQEGRHLDLSRILRRAFDAGARRQFASSTRLLHSAVSRWSVVGGGLLLASLGGCGWVGARLYNETGSFADSLTYVYTTMLAPLPLPAIAAISAAFLLSVTALVWRYVVLRRAADRAVYEEILGKSAPKASDAFFASIRAFFSEE